MTRSEQFPVGEVASLAVDIRSGSLDVRTGETGRITVTAEGSDVDDWHIDRLGDAVSVRPGRSGWRAPAARVLVEVPEGTHVDVKSVSADATLSGSLGTTRIKTVSGDVRIGSVDRLDVDTASGDARAVSVTTSAACSSASGAIHLERVGGRLTVSTASGDVRVVEAAADADIGTASGDVRIDRFDGDSIVVKALAGDVIVGLPAGIRVEPDLSTLSGRTHLPTPSTSPQDPANPPARIQEGPDPSTDRTPLPPPSSHRVSDAARRVVRVGIRTVSGDITIRRVDG